MTNSTLKWIGAVLAIGISIGTLGGLIALELSYTGLAYIFWGALIAFLFGWTLFAYGMRAGITAWICVGAVFLASTGFYAVSISKHPANRSPRPASIVPAPPPGPITWRELDRIYGVSSKATDLQKDDQWKKFKGKRGRFTGEVASVSQSLWALILGLKMKPSTLTYDISVTLRESERAEALRLRKGDRVTVEGRLESWGTLMPIIIVDGEIIVDPRKSSSSPSPSLLSPASSYDHARSADESWKELQRDLAKFRAENPQFSKTPKPTASPPR